MIRNRKLLKAKTETPKNQKHFGETPKKQRQEITFHLDKNFAVLLFLLSAPLCGFNIIVIDESPPIEGCLRRRKRKRKRLMGEILDD